MSAHGLNCILISTSLHTGTFEKSAFHRGHWLSERVAAAKAAVAPRLAAFTLEASRYFLPILRGVPPR